jgi:hypothetical protein
VEKQVGGRQEKSKFSGCELTKLRELKKAAELGFMSLDIVNPPRGAYWGKFNDRQLKDEWVNKLAEDFNSKLDNCTDGTAIEVAVKKEWLKDVNKIHRTVEGLTIQEVEVMDFTEEGKREIAMNNLWMLGGNHRRAALTLYLTSKRQELEETQKQIGTIKAEKRQGVEGTEEQDIASLKMEVEKLEDKIKTSTHWVVKLYDKGRSIHNRESRKN